MKSRLIVDGELTEIRIPGYSLLHQFDIPDGFLGVTDYDCPFEEAPDFIFTQPRIACDFKAIHWRRLLLIFVGYNRVDR